jgi:hypothetical protein
VGMAINGHEALIEIKGEGGLRKGNGRLKRRSEGGSFTALDCVGLMAGEAADPAGDHEWGRGHPAAGGRGRA